MVDASSSSSGYAVDVCREGETEWETVLCKDMAKLDGISPVRKTPEHLLKEKNTPKQRGRGAFTFGQMGLYSDRLSTCLSSDTEQQNRLSEEIEDEENIVDDHPKVAYGVRHVLGINFPPKVTTKDLEQLFKPFALQGVSIRWVNDTTALAVFRNPDVAREALECTQDPKYKVYQLAEDSTLCSLFNEEDLEPPIPRPATSSHAAQRMIMGALRNQGISSKVRSKNNFHDLQKQEDERRLRLLNRQKLRDEAWGPDD